MGFHLREDGVSRNHAIIENRGDRLIVTDLGSTNGVRINDTPVLSGYLVHGDSLRLGLALMEVVFPSDHRASQDLIRSVPPSPAHMVAESERTVMIPASEAANQAISRADMATLKNLQALYSIASTLAAEQDLKTLFDRISDEILRTIPADLVSLLQRSVTGEIEHREIRVRDGVSAATPRALHTIVDRVLTEGMAALAQDVLRVGRSDPFPVFLPDQVQSLMCVPLKGKAGVLGALYADSRSQAFAFGMEELHFFSAVGHQAGLAFERAQLVENLEKLFVGAIRTLVAAVDAKDQYTHGHSERVTTYALALADLVGLDGKDRELVELAGLLHDVGKIAVPERVLNKPADLSDREWRIIRLHPVQGSKIILNIDHPYIVEVAHAVRSHHERWDGRGYPDGLVGSRAPIIARILTVADAFDAMASDRPYRRSFGRSEALRRLYEASGTQFEPELVRAFLHLEQEGLLESSALPSKYSASTPRPEVELRSAECTFDEMEDDREDPTIPVVL